MRKMDLDQVLAWRLNPRIAKNMLTQIEDDSEKQMQWFLTIDKDETKRYWIINYNDTPIGVVNLAEIDQRNKKCTIGYYIGNEEYLSLGGLILPFIYNHVFLELDLDMIYGVLYEHNQKMLKLHQFHGYRIIENPNNTPLIQVELHKEDWIKKPRNLKAIAEFE
ncbi:MAG: UDP-4-amino-4,6-dideoxy-N-acetyl-beta-L-altrosamine N-acetyltransferase [Gammaproteobacteria bacterium]|nr:UDP-4-amino-4,6-dideoxy-N-acetyl-beta-L-altrosamine N-acetyltransferase [Gammaproteobacteria bacterium]